MNAKPFNERNGPFTLLTFALLAFAEFIIGGLSESQSFHGH